VYHSEEKRNEEGRMPNRMTGDGRPEESPNRPEAAAAGIGDLAAYLETVSPLPTSDRIEIVDQALALLEGCYVHLPLKRAMHAVDPVQRLRLLGHRLQGGDVSLSGRTFHDEMTAIFTSARDLHTNYLLPSPYRRLTAYLPFFVEECFDDARRPRYVVSKLVEGFEHPSFDVGTEILHWNGTPMARAVDRNGDRQAGSNPDARHARGLDSLTLRPMVRLLPPDETWVTVTFRTAAGKLEELRATWEVFSPEAGRVDVDPDTFSPSATALGIDVQTDAVHQAKKRLFAAAAVEADWRIAAGEAPGTPPGALPTGMPTVFRARPVKTRFGTFGYLRIFTFNVSDAGAFVREFVDLVRELPEDGLILDVRGNPGGSIWASEQLLQTLTPRPIEPARFQFINSPTTLRLCQEHSRSSAGLDLGPWVASVEEAVKTGATYSRAYPITDPDRCNAIGQKYCGPAVLITDALCYSATDLFAAGFQDHEIGPILGCSGNTGAGGANVWSHALVCQLASWPQSPFRSLPVDAGMNVSVRRSLRVGRRAGTPLEDLGVVPDELHWMTSRDVIGQNEDLIERAAALLAERKPYRLRVGINVREERAELAIATRNLASVDAYLDGRPKESLGVGDGEASLSVSVDPGAHRLEVKGYDSDGTLVAAWKGEV